MTNTKSSYNTQHFSIKTEDIMHKPFKIILQYIAPQHLLSNFAGCLANSDRIALKNYLIRYFLKRNNVNMTDAVIENPFEYKTFNEFFTRHLKPEKRPIAKELNEIASPVDGFVSNLGKITDETLIQAKGFNFTLTNLLGGSKKLAELFRNGSFATLYLSPKDYHRVHMPYAGKLRENIFIPGNLFSVNIETANNVPNLFARNERLVCIFDTNVGPMAVIFVGAMLVRSIHTSWHADTKSKTIKRESYAGSISVAKGDEIGFFTMGSTVIVLFGTDKAEWLDTLQEGSSVLMGQAIGHTKNPAFEQVLNKKG